MLTTRSRRYEKGLIVDDEIDLDARQDKILTKN